MLANFTKLWLPKAGAATAEVLIRGEELGYFDSWEGKQRVDTGAVNGVYDLFVCADSECGCGDSSKQSVPECLSKQPRAVLLIHN
jgi:hypothetical protein